MDRVCSSCGYERRFTDAGPEHECPNCGAVSARPEPVALARRNQQQLQKVRAIRRLRDYQDDRSINGLFRFGWMVTPLLCQIGFALYLIAASIGFVMQIVAGNGKTAAALLVSILLVRLFFEGVMVVFRLWSDVSDIRSLLAEQTVEGHQRGPTA